MNKEKEAQFEYKCRRCGKLYYNPCCNQDLAWQILVKASMRGAGGDIAKGGYVYLHSTHICGDKGMGLADLQGYRVVDTMEET